MKDGQKTTDPADLGAAASICLLALIACGLASYLAWHAFQSGSIIGCEGSSIVSCDEVLGTEWSRWLGIPVGILAVPVYAVIGLMSLLTMFRPSFAHRLGWFVLLPAATMAASAGLWFTGLQVFEVGKLCPYCMGAHLCGLLIWLLVLGRLLRLGAKRDAAPGQIDLGVSLFAVNRTLPGNRGLSLRASMSLLPLGLLCFAILPVGQIAFPPKTYEVTRVAGDDAADEEFFAAPDMEFEEIEAPVESEEPVASPTEDPPTAADVAPTLADNSSSPPTPGVMALKPVASLTEPILLGRDESPRSRDDVLMLGRPDAPYVMVELLDYTCRTCREMYEHVEAARKHYGDQLAVAVFPVALEKQCNPYLRIRLPEHHNACKLARLALAVWETDANRFVELHHWLMTSETFQKYSDAWDYAAQLVGHEALLTAIDQPQIATRLLENNRLWSKMSGTLPTLIIGESMVKGKITTDEQLFELLESNLDIRN